MFEVSAKTTSGNNDTHIMLIANQVTAIVQEKDACAVHTASGSIFFVTKPSYAEVCAIVKKWLKLDEPSA